LWEGLVGWDEGWALGVIIQHLFFYKAAQFSKFWDVLGFFRGLDWPKWKNKATFTRKNLSLSYKNGFIFAY